MENEKYSNYPLSISAILGLIEANDIAIFSKDDLWLASKTMERSVVIGEAQV